MGCFWSSQDAEDRCLYCSSRPVNNLVFINNVCEDCVSQSRSRPTVHSSNNLKPYYGEYRCSCGRFWSSRYARVGVYQMCERCREPTYPANMREVRLTDSSGDKENREEHKQELCQMCQQLGYHCARYRNRGRSHSNPPARQKRY